MPSKEVRQWRELILHRKKTVDKVVLLKNRIRATLEARGYRRAEFKGSWWSGANRLWMSGFCGRFMSG